MIYNSGLSELHDFLTGETHNISMGEVADVRILNVLAYSEGRVTLQELYDSFVAYDEINKLK